MGLRYEDLTCPLKKKQKYPWDPMYRRRSLKVLKDYSLLIDRPIKDTSTGIGTYGMGGVGYLGISFGEDWLVISLYGAGEKLSYDGKRIGDHFYERDGREKPIGDEGLRFSLLDRTIRSFNVSIDSLSIEFDSGAVVSLMDKIPDVDMRKQIYLSPSPYIWV